MAWNQTTKEGIILTIKATPRATKTEISGIDPDWVRMRIQAPPVDGKANLELVRFFSKLLRIPKNAVEILTGGTSRLKRVQLTHVTMESLLPYLPPFSK